MGVDSGQSYCRIGFSARSSELAPNRTDVGDRAHRADGNPTRPERVTRLTRPTVTPRVGAVTWLITTRVDPLAGRGYPAHHADGYS